MDLQELRKIRKEKKISLKRLEELTGVSKSVLYCIETETGNPSLQAVEKYADAVNLELRMLVKQNIK